MKDKTVETPQTPFSYQFEFRRLLKLFVPMFITQVSLVGISIINTKIIAELGAPAIAALGLSTTVLSMISAFTYTLLSPISNFVSHAIGQKDETKIITTVQQGFFIALVMCCLFSPVVYFSKYTIIPIIYLIDNHFSQEIVGYISIYLKGIAFLFPAYFFTIILRGFLEAHQKISITMNATIIAFTFNAITCYYLTYGVKGYFEGLGIMGASLSIALTYTLRFLILLIYVQTHQIYTTPIFSNFTLSPTIIKKIFRIGFPLALTFVVEIAVINGVSYALIPFGVYVIGASQIIQTVWQAFYQIPFGLNFIIGLRISYYLGEKRFEDVKKMIHLSLIIASVLGMVIASIIFFSQNFIGGFFTTDPLVLVQTQILLGVLAFILIPDTFQSVFSAIQKAHNDTVFPMIAYLGSYFLFMPMAYLFTYGVGFLPKLGPIALYYGFMCSLISVSLILYFRHRYIRTLYYDENFIDRFIENKKFIPRPRRRRI